jgi:cyclic pyranopterin phosphate synthase
VPSPRSNSCTPGPLAHGCYLRVSVTDRCNNRCRYCMPPGDRMLAPQARILRYEEIIQAIELINRVLPLRKIRVTGGEPLMRRNLASFIGQLRRHFPGAELAMTTNGTALARAAAGLKRAGLSRINVSLDALDRERFLKSTGSKNSEEVVRGIDAALVAGLEPVKLNSVLQRSINLDHLPDLVTFAAGRGCEIRFIELMSIGPARGLVQSEYVPMDEALETLRRRWPDLETLESGENSRRFRVLTDQGPAKVGFITPVSRPFCSSCDRLRLDAQGRLHACLRHGKQIDLRSMIRGRADAQWNLRQIAELLESKGNPGTRWSDEIRMFSMGG